MSDHSPAPARPMPTELRLGRAATAALGALLLVPAVYYGYAGIAAPPPGPGSLPVHGGLGLSLAALCGLPAVTAIVAAVLTAPFWRRGRHALAWTAAASGLAVSGTVVLFLVVAVVAPHGSW